MIKLMESLLAQNEISSQGMKRTQATMHDGYTCMENTDAKHRHL